MEKHSTQKNPLKLLHDSRGIYGLEYDNGADGVGTALRFHVRPDKVAPPQRAQLYDSALLHKMPRTMPVSCAIEADFTNRLRGYFHFCHTVTHGGAMADIPRKHHFAANARARAMTNALLGDLYEVADKRYLRTARRFSPSFRPDIYRGCVWGGERIAQMAEVFPMLALTAVREYHRAHLGYPDSPELFGPYRPPHHDPEPFEMIRAGAPMREIARRAGLDLVFRRVLPGAATDAANWLGTEDTGAIAKAIRDYLPAKLPEQRRFFAAIDGQRMATARDWLAANYAALGATKGEVAARAVDIRDWIKASEFARISSSDDGRAMLEMLRGDIAFNNERLDTKGAEFVTRQFNPRMSPATVFRLTDEWHETVSQHTDDGEPRQLPPAWMPSAEINGLKIEPVSDTAQLHRAARYMHNCAATYRGNIEFGQCCLFVVNKGDDDAPIAMAELRQRDGKPFIAQLKGRFNAAPDKDAKSAVSAWLRKHKGDFRMPPPPDLRAADLLGPIPF